MTAPSVVTCSVCYGGGKRKGKECPACKGKGKIEAVPLTRPVRR